MNKKFTLSLFSFFIVFLVHSQNPKWMEDMKAESSKTQTSEISDASGNIYTVRLINPGKGTTNNKNVSVSKSNGAGKFIWKKILTNRATPDYYEPAVTLDTAGNIYVSYNQRSSANEWNSYVTRLDASGTIGWTKCLGDCRTGGINVRSISFDEKNRICITGFFCGAFDFNTPKGISQLVSPDKTNVFVCKMDNSGNYLWVHSIEKAEPISPVAINRTAAEQLETTASAGTSQ